MSRFRRNKLDILVFIFFFVSAFSLLINFKIPKFEDLESFYPLLQFLSLSIAFGLYILAKEILHSRKQISPILMSVMLTGVFVSLVGFIDIKLDLNLFNNQYIKPLKEVLGYKIGVNRIMSTFDNPNLLGMYLIYVLPLCFYLAYDENEKPKRWMMFLVSLFLLYILWMTDDKSSIIALSYGMSIILFLNMHRFVKKHAVWLIIFMFIVIGSLFVYNNFSRGEGRINVLWPTALKIFIQNPIFGVGLGNYYSAYKQLSIFDWNFAFHTHNIYFQILAERGLIAFLFFILILISFFVTKIKYLKITPRYNYLTISLLFAVICTLISGLMQYSFSWLGLELHFWLYLLVTIEVIEDHIKWDI